MTTSKIPEELFLEISEYLIGNAIKTVNNKNLRDPSFQDFILIAGGNKAIEAILKNHIDQIQSHGNYIFYHHILIKCLQYL